jgi:glucose-6-phosphate 1-dehydrogenase
MKTSTILRPADSCALVIFGGNGDLTWRKFVPSLFDLYIDKSLPKQMAIIAVDRADIDDAALRKRLRAGVKEFARAGKPQDWRNFEAHLSYCRGDFENSKTYVDLRVGSRDSTKIGTPKRPAFFTSLCRPRCSARFRRCSPRLASQVISNGLASLSKSRSATTSNQRES